jgi:peptidoglycan DL-endopeptidase CwlO
VAVAVAWVGTAMAKAPAPSGYPYAGVCPAAGIRDDVDRWRMNTCNCTSFVAWALAAHGYRTDWFIAGAMDSWNWPHVAQLAHLTVDQTPRVGSVAVWPHWGRFGHLAFVTGIHDDGTFDVAEYNLPGRQPRFGFDIRRDISSRGASFIHVPRRTRSGSDER